VSDCGCEIEIKDACQTKVLMVLLAINATMCVFELGLGWYAQSTGPIADSMDMLIWLLNSRWPDLIIGTLITLVILNGARHIILDARQELAADVLAVAMESVAARRPPPVLISH
jgi:Co/Zn/Cd efflux system component